MINRKAYTDPIALTIILVMIITGQIFYNAYIRHTYSTFTSEEDIESAKDANFGFLAPYL